MFRCGRDLTQLSGVVESRFQLQQTLRAEIGLNAAVRHAVECHDVLIASCQFAREVFLGY